MAAVAKSSKGVSLATKTPGYEHRDQHLLATEAIAAGDMCKITSAGISRAVNLELAHGMALSDAAAGEPVTLFHDVVVRYGDALTGGTSYFLSTTVPGGLDTTANGAAVAYALDSTRIRVLRKLA